MKEKRNEADSNFLNLFFILIDHYFELFSKKHVIIIRYPS